MLEGQYASCLSNYSDYETYVKERALRAMGFTNDDVQVLSLRPGDKAQLAMGYRGPNDQTADVYWPNVTTSGAAGFYSDATRLAKFASQLYQTDFLPEPVMEEMLQNECGVYIYEGIYGQYSHHVGQFGDGVHQPVEKGIVAAHVKLSHGYDCALLINTLYITDDNGNTSVIDPIGWVIDAFEGKLTPSYVQPRQQVPPPMAAVVALLRPRVVEEVRLEQHHLPRSEHGEEQ
jgi:CubicO group peptidase (beta-lactamase class C family)